MCFCILLFFGLKHPGSLRFQLSLPIASLCSAHLCAIFIRVWSLIHSACMVRPRLPRFDPRPGRRSGRDRRLSSEERKVLPQLLELLRSGACIAASAIYNFRKQHCCFFIRDSVTKTTEAIKVASDTCHSKSFHRCWLDAIEACHSCKFASKRQAFERRLVCTG